MFCFPSSLGFHQLSPSRLQKWSRPSVCTSVRICGTYVVHHFVGTQLCCAPLTCVVHHGAQRGTCFLAHLYMCSCMLGSYSPPSVCLSVCPSGFVGPTLCTTSSPCVHHQAALCTTRLHCVQGGPMSVRSGDCPRHVVLYRRTLWWCTMQLCTDQVVHMTICHVCYETRPRWCTVSCCQSRCVSVSLLVLFHGVTTASRGRCSNTLSGHARSIPNANK